MGYDHRAIEQAHNAASSNRTNCPAGLSIAIRLLQYEAIFKFVHQLVDLLGHVIRRSLLVVPEFNLYPEFDRNVGLRLDLQ